MNIKRYAWAAAAVMMAALPMQAQAAVATGQINVSATTVAATASVNVAGPIGFGAVVDTGTSTANSREPRKTYRILLILAISVEGELR